MHLSGVPYDLITCIPTDTLYFVSDEHAFLLQRVQPAMVGLIDGSLSTLAPIFAVVLASHDTRYAFIAGLATSLGAAISMGFSEALEELDDCEAEAYQRGRRPYPRHHRSLDAQASTDPAEVAVRGYPYLVPACAWGGAS